MYASIDSDEVFAIHDIRSAETFFTNLPIILRENTWTVGIWSYQPDPKIKSWFEKLPPLDVPMRFDRRALCRIYKRQFPNCGMYFFRAEARLLKQLADLASQIPLQSLCEHVIGFAAETAILSFHDAFDCDPLLVSKKIPEELIQKFCATCECSYSTIQNPEHDWKRE